MYLPVAYSTAEWMLPLLVPAFGWVGDVLTKAIEIAIATILVEVVWHRRRDET
ncbi:hypothetical protein [Haloferax larsenii]|uniref:hypothetical protein n=1 Tax=Haloferax larsenii TaxID=302484 RepID=UPI00147E5452|nr:hypothetical protein [Haloferax larsenii]